MPRLPAHEIARLKPVVLARVAEGEAVTGVMRALGLGATAAQNWAKTDAGFRAALLQALEVGRARWMRGYRARASCCDGGASSPRSTP